MIASYTYTYSDGFVGGYNQISKTETKNGASAETTAYEYDAWGRLIKVTHPSGTVNAYTYDTAGNRLSKVSSKDGIIATNVYSYDEQNRLTETVATTTGSSAEVHTYFGYDNNGNQISKWVQSVGVSDGENLVALGELGVNAADDMALYSYDNFNRLTGILQGNTTIRNAYNGRGRKISRTTDGETRYYVYDGNTVIAELDGQKELKARNVYGRNLISRTTDKPMIMSYNGHGDIVLVKSVSGETLAEYAYDEFGNVLAQNGELDNPYRYAGYEYLDSVDLYDLNARYYNPKTARFLSEDPYYNLGNRVIGLYEINVPSVLSIMQANALYAYALGSPIMLFDPSGFAVSKEDKKYLSLDALRQLIEYTHAYEEAEKKLNYIGMNEAHRASTELRQQYYDYVDTYDYTYGGKYDIYTNFDSSYQEGGYYETVYQMDPYSFNKFVTRSANLDSDTKLDDAVAVVSFAGSFITEKVISRAVTIFSIAYEVGQFVKRDLERPMKGTVTDVTNMFIESDTPNFEGKELYVYCLDGGFSPELKVVVVNPTTNRVVSSYQFNLYQYSLSSTFFENAALYGTKVAENRRHWQYTYTHNG